MAAVKKPISFPDDVWRFLKQARKQYGDKLSTAVAGELRKSAAFRKWAKTQGS